MADGLELWGGHECTINRVGDQFFDQTALSGHYDRADDVDLFAGLGLRTLRYPILWEKVAPDSPDMRDWSWVDDRLERLQAYQITPIVGLTHHGSGPRYVDLLSESFAPGLAAHALAVARRYPWIDVWTPVNEPLTTARFSALYGLWYPHAKDERLFWLALLNQIDAVRLSMTAIRSVNPAARLLQTEDFGRTYATLAVGYQANFDNDRRWMTWDLLCGRVTRQHPLWERLARLGLEARLDVIADAPSPPDILGVNHYLTSDRFLDNRTSLYPPEKRGGNGMIDFADVEAVRVLLPGPSGMAGAVDDVWSRYGLPIALTEVHNGCSREEQLRWLTEAWRTARAARRRGVDLKAVTAWSLLGSFNWNCLLTSANGRYEPGAFDVSGPRPRPTALARLVGDLAREGDTHWGLAEAPGWWRRDVRLQFAPVGRWAENTAPPQETIGTGSQGRPLLITGATGTLGQALARACAWRGLDYVLTSRAELELEDSGTISARLDALDPWAVINAAGFVRVDEAEAERAACMAANAGGAVRLAEACAARDITFVGVSSDLVFDGSLSRPHGESDQPRPVNVYGESKLCAERGVMDLGGRALIIRTAAFFSPFDPHNFAAHVAGALAANQPFRAADDLIISPTYVPDLVDAALDLLIDGETGLWHLANGGEVSWARFARMIASALEFDPDLVAPTPAAEFGWLAPRPRCVPLVSERGRLMPSLEDALGRCASAMRVSYPASARDRKPAATVLRAS